MIDNCSAHGQLETFPPLPEVTGQIQPLDAGIIAWVKVWYKRWLLPRVFNNIGMGWKSIYNVDVLTAIRWAKLESENCTLEVIKSCFRLCLEVGGWREPIKGGRGSQN